MKCSHLCFFERVNLPGACYRVEGGTISDSKSYKDLGVLVTDNLAWSNHVSAICSRAYTSLYVIKRNTPANSSVGLKRRLYLSLVRSHLSYGCQLWHPILFKDIRNIERVQRRATKFILQDYRSNYKARLTSLLLLPVSMWFELQDILFLVKCLKHPPDNFNILDYISFTTTTTRSSSRNNLAVKYRRTNAGRHFYFNRIVRLWNSLPQINLDSSLPSIKNHLTNFLWNHFQSNFTQDNYCTYHFRCPCSDCHLSQY